MINGEIVTDIDADVQSQELRMSRLAIASIVFGILGPFSAGAMWILSYCGFLKFAQPIIVAPFSCGLTWVLGLGLGMKSLRRIDDSDRRLIGREYAFIGIIVSVAWMLTVFVGLLLPMIYCVNS